MKRKVVAICMAMAICCGVSSMASAQIMGEDSTTLNQDNQNMMEEDEEGNLDGDSDDDGSENNGGGTSGGGANKDCLTLHNANCSMWDVSVLKDEEKLREKFERTHRYIWKDLFKY